MTDTSSISYFIWGVFPYVALTSFFVVPFIRMIYRPFGLTTRASGIFANRETLGLAAHLLHWGIFLVFFGHIAGLVGGIRGWGEWVGAFFWMGTIGGIAAITGSIIALVRRIRSPEMRAMSQPDDYIVHLFLIAILGVAIFQAVAHRIWGLSFTAGPWFSSLWRFHPQPELMASASLLTKIHIFLAFAFATYFPFTKLIHAWTWPVNYMVRPYQVMRTTALKFQNRWEFGLVSDKSYMTYLGGTVVLLLLGAGFLLPAPTIEGASSAVASGTTTDGIVGGALASTSDEPALLAKSEALEGYPLYVSQCARCHGLSGKGDGMGAKSPTFSTVPRDLTAGYFRFVSTTNGVASDDDLRRVIVNGLDGSGMPSFSSLSDRQIQSLIEVVGYFWKQRPSAGDPIAVPARPVLSMAMVGEGRKLFGEACAVCHGAGGRGDGERAEGITDSFGHPVRPRNLVSDPIRGGSSPAQLYRRIAAGIPGGKDQWLMPQFRDLGPNKIWALVSYLEAEILPSQRAAVLKTQPTQKTAESKPAQ
jgi:respiratory nitrate reductase gamma subunit